MLRLVAFQRTLWVISLLLLTNILTVHVGHTQPANAFVISEIFGGGSGTGLQGCDYIELYNGTNGTIDFSTTPYSVQHATAAGNFAQKIDLTTGSIVPGAYFLIAGTCNDLAGFETAVGAPVDASGTMNITTSDQKIALLSGTTLLDPCVANCATDANVVDFVGMGTATSYEGSAAAVTPTATSAIHRLGDQLVARYLEGDVDNDDNSVDWYRNVQNPKTGIPAPVLTPPVNGVGAGGIYISHEISGLQFSSTVLDEEQVDRTDDGWRAAVDAALGGAPGATSFKQIDIGSPNVTASTDLVHGAPVWTYTGGSTSFSFTAYQMNMSPAGTGSEHATCTIAKIGGLVHSSQPSANDPLQDNPPEPNIDVPGSNANAIDNAYNDSGVGDNSNPNGVLVAFSPPIRAWGAFFADIETRDPETLTQAMIDAHPAGTFAGMSPGDPIGGALATVQLFDADCNPIGVAQPVPAFLDDNEDGVNESPVVTNPATDFRSSTCGGDSTNGYGCGNHTTRWIGFANGTTPVSYMLLVVGDDDVQGADGDGDVATAGTGVITSCDGSNLANFTQRCEGGQEYISFARGTVLVAGAVPTAVSFTHLTALPTATPWLLLIVLLGLLGVTAGIVRRGV
ncbi:MAG: hypothetical protein KDE56_18340 [Anaerolineales bacterium]|nr:hypothetical protein [Anaerolineales bacterium]